MLRFGFKKLRHEGGRGLTLSLKPLAISLFVIFCLLNANAVFAGTVTLSWDIPTTNTDGSQLTDLTGYKVYYGTSSGSYNQSIDVGNITTHTLNLTDGITYYFTVTVYNTLRSESSYSNEVCRTIGSTTCSGGSGGGSGGSGSGTQTALNSAGDTSISGGGCGFMKNLNGKGAGSSNSLQAYDISIAMLFLLLLTFLKLKKKQNFSGGLFMMMNTKKSHPIWLSFSLAVLLFSYPAISEAATYYVSNSGSAAWSQCTNINTPCAVQTAFNNAVAGDIVYFRGGTYNVPAKNFGSTYHGYYEPANSGTSGNPITFAAYPGETPIFNGTAGGTGDGSDYATIFGTFGRSYVVFDGVKLQADNGTRMARVHIGSDDSNVVSVGITVKNCDVNGGSTQIPTQDNRETIRIDFADDVLIQRCRIYNARSTNGYLGINGIKAYTANRVTVENNEIYNTEGGIYLKSITDSWIVRNNWIHNNQIGIYVTPYFTSAVRNATNHKFYNNVISHSSYSSIHVYSEAPARADNMEVYNNTIYGVLPNSWGIFLSEGSNFKIYSNIIQGFANHQMAFGYANYYITESSYNQFGTGSFLITTHMYNNTLTYSSLTSWKASGELFGGGNPDLNSLASNPLFTNASGAMTQLNDFRLANNSPSKGTGKGGVDMGANIDSVGTGAKIPSSTNLTIP